MHLYPRMITYGWLGSSVSRIIAKEAAFLGRAQLLDLLLTRFSANQPLGVSLTLIPYSNGEIFTCFGSFYANMGIPFTCI